MNYQFGLDWTTTKIIKKYLESLFLCTVANQCTYVSIEDGVVRIIYYQSVCHVVLLFLHSCFKDVFIILSVCFFFLSRFSFYFS